MKCAEDLVGARWVQENRTVVAHPVEKRPPIRGRIDVRRGRLPVAVAVVVIERATAAMMPVPARARLGRITDDKKAHGKRGNRSQNRS